jgi:hypothetical protein
MNVIKRLIEERDTDREREKRYKKIVKEIKTKIRKTETLREKLSDIKR